MTPTTTPSSFQQISERAEAARQHYQRKQIASLIQAVEVARPMFDDPAVRSVNVTLFEGLPQAFIVEVFRDGKCYLPGERAKFDPEYRD